MKNVIFSHDERSRRIENEGVRKRVLKRAKTRFVRKRRLKSRKAWMEKALKGIKIRGTASLLSRFTSRSRVRYRRCWDIHQFNWSLLLFRRRWTINRGWIANETAAALGVVRFSPRLHIYCISRTSAERRSSRQATVNQFRVYVRP